METQFLGEFNVENYRDKVSTELTKYKETNDFTQKDIANKFLVSPQAVSLWIKKERNIDIEKLLILSKIINKDISYFLDLKNEPFRMIITLKKQFFLYRPTIKIFHNNHFYGKVKSGNSIKLISEDANNKLVLKHFFRNLHCDYEIESSAQPMHLNLSFDRNRGQIDIDYDNASYFTYETDKVNLIVFSITIALVIIAVLYSIYVFNKI